MTRAIVVALAVLVLGVVSYSKTPKDLLPQFETPAVQIVTFYPGMPPEVMEKDIMSRLQRWTGQSVGILPSRSQGHAGRVHRQGLFSRRHFDGHVNGMPVRMRDIGQVENSHQIQSNIVRINQARQVYIPIYRQPGANTIEIVDRIRSLLPGILTRLQNERSEDAKMATVVLSVAMDQSDGVRNSIRGLYIAGGLGAVLAGIVVLVFLRSFRSTMVVVLAIPLSILAALLGIYFKGATINAMTLGGLALAIGILVDQSIVVLENITRHVRMGKRPGEAALEGTREVAMPVLVSTITFIVVFVPVVFLSGMAKFLFTPLAISASVAILASYIISITLIPAYCAKFFGGANIPTESSHLNEDAYRVSRDGIVPRLLRGLIVLRYPIVLGAVVLFGISLFGLVSDVQDRRVRAQGPRRHRRPGPPRTGVGRT